MLPKYFQIVNKAKGVILSGEEEKSKKEKKIGIMQNKKGN
jgi:hypothetical protein